MFLWSLKSEVVSKNITCFFLLLRRSPRVMIWFFLLCKVFLGNHSAYWRIVGKTVYNSIIFSNCAKLSAFIIQWLGYLVVAEETWVRFSLGAITFSFAFRGGPSLLVKHLFILISLVEKLCQSYIPLRRILMPVVSYIGLQLIGRNKNLSTQDICVEQLLLKCAILPE